MSLANIGLLLRILAVAAYLASLALPPYKTRGPHMEEMGLMILLIGWVTVLELMSAWLANPLAIFCFFQMKAKPYLCSVLSALALLATHDLAKVESLGWDSSSEIYFGTVIGLNIGCYLWLSSLVLTFLASVAHLHNSRQLSAKHA